MLCNSAIGLVSPAAGKALCYRRFFFSGRDERCAELLRPDEDLALADRDFEPVALAVCCLGGGDDLCGARGTAAWCCLLGVEICCLGGAARCCLGAAGRCCLVAAGRCCLAGAIRIDGIDTARETGFTGWVLTGPDLLCRGERTVALPRCENTTGPIRSELRLITGASGLGVTGAVRVRPCLLPARERTSPAGVREEMYAWLLGRGLSVTMRVDGEIFVTGLVGSGLVRVCLRSSRLRTSIPRLKDPRPGATETCRLTAPVTKLSSARSLRAGFRDCSPGGSDPSPPRRPRLPLLRLFPA